MLDLTRDIERYSLMQRYFRCASRLATLPCKIWWLLWGSPYLHHCHGIYAAKFSAAAFNEHSSMTFEALPDTG